MAKSQSKYNPDYHIPWAWSLASRGAIDEEIADAFGISVRTLHRWKKAHPEFGEMLSSGKEPADAKVERSLFQRALGYSWTEQETIVEMKPDGSPKPAKIRKIDHHAPPDVMAQMYWLNNRQPDRYRRNPENNVGNRDAFNDGFIEALTAAARQDWGGNDV